MAVVPNQQAAANSVLVRVPIPQSVAQPQRQPASPPPAQNPPSNSEDSAQPTKTPAAFILPYLPAAGGKLRYSRAGSPFENLDHDDLANAIHASARDWHEGPRVVEHADYDPKAVAAYAAWLARRGDPREHIVSAHLRTMQSDRTPYELVKATRTHNAKTFDADADDHAFTLHSLNDGRLIAHLDQYLPAPDDAFFGDRLSFIGEVTPAQAQELLRNIPADDHFTRRGGEKFLKQHLAAHQKKPTQYAARKAPADGVIHRGLFYEGGSFLPNMPAGNQPAAQPAPAPTAEHPRLRILKQLRSLLADKKPALKYSARGSKGSTVEQGTAPQPVEPLTAEHVIEHGSGLVGVKAQGHSGDYFRHGDHFYKKPSNPAHLHSEPAAAKFFQELGVKHVIPAEAIHVGGEGYLRSPYLQDAFRLSDLKSTPAHTKVSEDQITRHALAGWLAGATDRHYGNYLLHNGQLKAIDFGEAFHPALTHPSAHGQRPLDPELDSLVPDHIRGPIKIPHALIDEILAKEPQLRKLVQEGTAGLNPFYRQEAEDWFDEKLDHLSRLKGMIGTPTTYHLPTYDGMKSREPYANG